jgi:hypothetical protein
MSMTFQNAQMNLGRSTFLRIAGEPGVELRCLKGCLWITRDGSPADIELHPGERHVVGDTARVIVCAFEPSLVQVVRPATGPVGALRRDSSPAGPARWLRALRRRGSAVAAAA